MQKRALLCRCNFEQRGRLSTALRTLCQFMLSHLQNMLQNDLLNRLSNKLVENWFFSKLYLVSHPAQHTLVFLFAHFPDDIL